MSAPATAQQMELATLEAVAGNLVALAASRDDLVVSLHRQGVSLRVIAQAAGMSHVGVKKLVERLDRVRELPPVGGAK